MKKTFFLFSVLMRKNKRFGFKRYRRELNTHE
jgi:hypothetical protein